MNFRHSYEQLIADKLRKLPTPDADASWQQMKRLLDDEDSKPGGAKRPPGKGRGLWRMGILAIGVLMSGWLYLEKTATADDATVKSNTAFSGTAAETTATKKVKVSANNQTNAIDKNITLPVTDLTSSSNNDKIAAAKTATLNTTGNTKNDAVANTNAATGISGNNNKTAPLRDPIPTGTTAAIKDNNESSLEAGNVLAGDLSGTNKQIENGRVPGAHSTTGKQGQGITSGETLTASENNIAETAAGKIKNKNAYPGNHHPQKNNGDAVAENNNHYLVSGHYQPSAQTGADERSWFDKLNDVLIPGGLPFADMGLAVPDSAANQSVAGNLLNNETKKKVAKAQRDKELEDMTRKEKKSFHLDLSNVFKPFSLRLDAEPRWAAGIALNSGVPVGAQSRFNYSMTGKSGTFTDYIPSVYLQFHLNDYVYAQTEINFVSPQYTPQLLVYQQTNDLAAQAQPGFSSQKSVYIQKLYYFNLPVTLHYSPVNNVYFSAGLQFSSFQSGLASIQEKQYDTQAGPDHPSSFSNTVLKFKDDSIAAKLAPNEWRWKVGAEYYWNRFTVGMHYNRSLKNLANVNLSGSSPATALRNESFILSLRYNLFESRKKN